MADTRRPRKTDANAIERKLDTLSSSVGAQFEAIGQDPALCLESDGAAHLLRLASKE